MSLLITLIGFLLVLGPLVFFHELGHFLLAKLSHIRVIEFGFGYPPRIWKLWQSEGRITIAGVHIAIPRNFRAHLSRQDAERLFKRPGTDKSAGFGFLDRLPLPGDVMDVMEKGRSVEATVALQPDGRHVLQSIKLLDPSTDHVESMRGTTFVRGEVSDYAPGTEYTLNWLPVGGFTRMLGEEDPTAPDSFAAASKRRRAATLLAGPGMNVLVAFVLFVVMFMVGTPEPKDTAVAIGSVRPGSPAEMAGLRPGDLILAVNGQKIPTTQEVSQITHANLGKEIVLSIQRDQDKFDLRATPRRADEFDPTKEGPLGITIGEVALSWGLRYYSVWEAVPFGMQETLGVVRITVFAPVAVIRGILPADAMRVSGPVGIAQLAGSQAEASIRLGGLFPILRLAGFLSVAIGLTNLLPIPALDGGRLMFILIELIRRRRVDPRKETIVHLVGMALLLTFLLLVTLQDILNPIPIPKTF